MPATTYQELAQLFVLTLSLLPSSTAGQYACSGGAQVRPACSAHPEHCFSSYAAGWGCDSASGWQRHTGCGRAGITAPWRFQGKRNRRPGCTQHSVVVAASAGGMTRTLGGDILTFCMSDAAQPLPQSTTCTALLRTNVYLLTGLPVHCLAARLLSSWTDINTAAHAFLSLCSCLASCAAGSSG
jgi:hypothetical protein